MAAINKTLFLFFLFIGASLIAQEKPDAWKEKVKNISGDVSEIVIKTDKGEVKLTGEDAENVMELLKSDYLFSFDGDEFETSSAYGDPGEKVFVVKMKNGCSGMKSSAHHKGSKHMIWVSADADENEIEKNIEVEVKEGKKKVTVTTVENGKEITKVYEGEEAEKFLESEEGENIVIDETGHGCKERHSYKRHCGGGRHGNKVIIIDDDNNVILKDGAEKVKVIKVKVQDDDDAEEEKDEK